MKSVRPSGALRNTSGNAPGAERSKGLRALDPRGWFSAARRDTSASAGGRAGKVSRFDRFLDLGIYVALVGLIVFFSLASPYFLTPRNLASIGFAVAVTGVLAAGMTIALIAGQLDLTVGANLALVSVVVAISITDFGIPVVPAAMLGIATGVLVGIVNTLLIVKARINSIIATLAFGIVLRGISLILTSGQNRPITDPSLQGFVTAQVLGVPVSVLILVVVYLIAWVILSFTAAGWNIYSTGGNASAATRAGISTNKVYLMVFMITGGLAAVGGVITAGIAGSGGPAYGIGAEFSVLAAVLLGGIGLSGGSGRIQRTLAGVLVIGILNNGLTLLSVDTYYQQLARGVVFLLAVVIAATAEGRRSR